MKNKQRGYIGKGIADAIAFAFIGVAIVSAVGGWALIEGLIWIFRHLTIGWSA
ncbi:TPA: hypothetical protein SL665_001606 [Pseudomonas aeruginosa]|uniref:hypothetical protein n=1 Tax=Pseudomonas aeruginosa group TaxID=136841 RepID=UPI0003B958C9|nr:MULTISPECIES: hypothetical protein [Pseudomonas aeruginosa group]ARG88692.1 hypothetical protein E613_46270 [Pseudomonas aeruginosa]EKX8735894.1 hypothetical protein [Pseudomonas aeruginosa]ERY01383.1 hypothetical protein Q077_05190 [Pseudomonas aeruginosa BL23]MBA5053209.1 hypothetical protein [Pseudomonas aeruginosa]MBO2862724.1 hypothetical protein [Pseudomonas aeruginosa]